MKRILVTGMSGLIGGLLKTKLEESGEFTLSALNRRRVPGIMSYQANIADKEAIMSAFTGQEVVVHLAAQVSSSPWESLLSTNLIGTRNVFEAAVKAGVKRIVFASSGSTVKGLELTEPYQAIIEGRYQDVPEKWPMVTHELVSPADEYGASKVWGEALGRHYSISYGVSVICVRIGAVPEMNRPRNPREYAVYLSHKDVADMLRRCIDAPEDLKYDIFFATSRNKWGFRDLLHPKKLLGFVPQDSAESFRESKTS